MAYLNSFYSILFLILSIQLTAVQPIFATTSCSDVHLSKGAGKLARPSQIDANFFLKGRVDPKDLYFDYYVSSEMNEGLGIMVYYKNRRNPVAFLDAGNWNDRDIPRVGRSDIKRDTRGVGSFIGVGIGSMMYTIVAKLSYDTYKKPLGGSYESQSEDAENLWRRFRKNGFASRSEIKGRFNTKLLASEDLDPLMEYFYSRARWKVFTATRFSDADDQ